jgi:uncharacterized membrane protein YdjX (TVP38/TMEM64 family)
MKRTFFIILVCICTIATAWVAMSHIDWFSRIQIFVQDAGAWGGVIFVVAYAIATLLILPVTAFNIAGGALYGGVQGLLLTSTGALFAAFVGFVLARSLGTRFIPVRESWSGISQNLVNGGIAYSFASRLFPLIPYGVVSFAAGLSPIKRRDYLIGTILGTPLGILPFVLLGSTGVQMAASHDILPLLATSLGLGILIVTGVWYKQSQKISQLYKVEEQNEE